MSVHGSDEEVDEPLEIDSDEDLSDGQKQLEEEVRMCLFLMLVRNQFNGKNYLSF